jgi:thioesterase domain-containing protein
MEDSREYLQRMLYEEIPLSRAMGLTVAAYDGQALRLAAPLALNLNHKSTAFGGSLYSIAVLAGWGLLFLKLAEIGESAQLVIQDAEIDYTLPIDADFQAVCRIPEGQAFDRFLTMFRRRGKARIRLEAQVSVAARVAVDFRGSYVAHR